MTKKDNPFEGAEIDNDSEPLRFEEATSLFEDGPSAESKPIPQETEEEVVEEQAQEPIIEEQIEAQEIEQEENIDDGIHTIGAFLHQMREEKNINLKIISQHTKISVTNLEHLESDKLEKLPNRAYVIGYVKSYAKALHLDQADCLELLDATYGIEKEVVTKSVQETSTVSKLNNHSSTESEKSDSNGIKIGFIIAIVAAGAFLLILKNTGDKEEVTQEPVVQKEVEAPKAVVPQTLGASTPLKEETVDVLEEEITVKVSTPSIQKVIEVKKPEPIATPVPKKQLEEIKKEPVVEAKKEVKTEVKKVEPKKEKKKDEKISFRSVSTQLYSDDKSMSQSRIDELLPTKYRAAIVAGQHNVFVNAYKEASWLTYKSDDGPIKKFILRKGRTILIRGSLVRIFLGNLGAVKVFRNNIPQKITSPSGVKSLVFPQEKASDFVIPLFIYNKNGTVQTSEEYLDEQEN